jgi:hypothetical protein
VFGFKPYNSEVNTEKSTAKRQMLLAKRKKAAASEDDQNMKWQFPLWIETNENMLKIK